MDSCLAEYIESKYGEISSIKKLKGGINCRVYRVSCFESIILKYYADETRMSSELLFLQACKEVGLDCIPSVLYSSKPLLCSLTTDVGSNPVENVSTLILDSALSMQESLVAKCTERVLPLSQTAREGCFSSLEHIRVINRRLNLFRSSELFIKYSSLYYFISCLIDHNTSAYKLEYASRYEDTPVQIWPSQSDVGIHNIVEDSKANHYKFVDFEYAGWDDKAKYFIDWMIRPGSDMSVESCQYLLNKALNKMLISPIDLKRIFALWGLYTCKWSIIRLNYLDKHHNMDTITIEMDMRNYFLSSSSLKEALLDVFM